MSASSTRAYLENYYMTSIPNTVVFPERMYTAAELQAAALQKDSWKEFTLGAVAAAAAAAAPLQRREARRHTRSSTAIEKN